jgi:hypothetical protein
MYGLPQVILARRRNGVNGASIHHSTAVQPRLTNRPPTPPFASDLLETVFGLTLFRYDRHLFGLTFSLAFGHWIDPSTQ